MKLKFLGAAKEVTGSCFLLSACGKNILIDCGMIQGGGEERNEDFAFTPADIDYVLLTHAHIDHSGRLPLLVRRGYNGMIYTTGATCRLLSIMLRDSAKIQEMDAMWENRKGKRAGLDEVEPLYTTEDADKTLEYLVPHKYNERFTLCDGVEVVFIDAGHLLGSSSICIFVTEDSKTEKIVFSGDIGNLTQPIINDPHYIEEADYTIMEATYGDRDHEIVDDYTEALANIIDTTLAQGGNVIIPSFAVGRTQELLYFLREIKERRLVKSIPNFSVVVDSPLSIEATKIYSGDLDGYIDDESKLVIARGAQPIDFPGLSFSQTSEESKELNASVTPQVIISSSGMCEAGRIRHHLKHNLWRRECAVVFVGYQANGTLGRLILDGIQKVRLFGEEIAVRAKIYNFRGLSAHADRTGLLFWASAFTEKPKKIFIVHSEESSAQSFESELRTRGFNATTPNLGALYDLTSGIMLEEGTLPVRRETKEAVAVRRGSPAYTAMLAALRHLTIAAEKLSGAPNKDLKKFTSLIEELASRLER